MDYLNLNDPPDINSHCAQIVISLTFDNIFVNNEYNILFSCKYLNFVTFICSVYCFVVLFCVYLIFIDHVKVQSSFNKFLC